MSANEPTHHPVVATQPAVATTPATTTPVVVAGETRPEDVKAVKKRYGVKRFIASILLVCITVLLLMCLVSGRWIKGDDVRIVAGTANSNQWRNTALWPLLNTSTSQHEVETWPEVSIWGTCQCFDINDATPCGERDRKLNAAKAFSIIAAGFEFFAVLVLLWFPYGKRGRFVIAALAFIAFCSLVITVALWGNLFNDRICGFKYEAEGQHLDWAYGIRIAEVVFALILTILVAVRPHGPFVVFFAILLLYLTVFTTTSRGWASRKVYVDRNVYLPRGASETWEYGLWDRCECRRAGVIECDQIRRLMRAAEAFEIIATAVAIILTAFVVKAPKVPRIVGAILAWFLFIFMILPWIFVAAIWNQTYCGGKVKNTPGFNLHWAFGIQVAISGLMIPTAALISIM